MSGFSEMMCDDGFTDADEYLDYLTQKDFEREDNYRNQTNFDYGHDQSEEDM